MSRASDRFAQLTRHHFPVKDRGKPAPLGPRRPISSRIRLPSGNNDPFVWNLLLLTGNTTFTLRSGNKSPQEQASPDQKPTALLKIGRDGVTPTFVWRE